MGYDIERINFTVPARGLVKTAYRTRAGNKRITGIMLVAHSGDASVIGSAMKMSIDKREVFSSDFDPSLLGFTQVTPVNSRWYPYVNRDIDQSDIDIEFTDNAAAAGGVFSLLINCERDD